MKNALIFALALLLLSTVGFSAVTKTVSIKTTNDQLYFCNPCWYIYSNDTDSVSGRTELGGSSFSFTAADAADYSISIKAELQSLNYSLPTVFLASGDTAITATIPLTGYDDIAFIVPNGGYAPSANQWRSLTAYSWTRYKNITKSFGFKYINRFSGGLNYTATSTPSVDELSNYDAIMVGYVTVYGGLPAFSSALVSSLELAVENGVRVVAPVTFLSKSDVNITSTSSVNHTTLNTAPTSISADAGFLQRTGSQIPGGRSTIGSPPSLHYPDFSDGMATWQRNHIEAKRIKLSIGSRSDIEYSGTGVFPSWTRIGDNLYVTPWMQWKGDLQLYEWSNTYTALMYIALIDTEFRSGSGSAILSGSVFFDFSGDGKYNATNPAKYYHQSKGVTYTGDYFAEGMTIELYDNFGTLLGETQVKGGRYSFSGLQNGVYRPKFVAENRKYSFVTTISVQGAETTFDIPIYEWMKIAAIVARSVDVNQRDVEDVDYALFDDSGELLANCTGTIADNNNRCRFYVYAPVAFSGEVKATYTTRGTSGAQMQDIASFLVSHDVDNLDFIFNPDLISIYSLNGTKNSVTVITRDGKAYENYIPVGKQVKNVLFRIHKKNYGYITIPGTFWEHNYGADTSVPTSPMFVDLEKKCDEENDNNFKNTGKRYTTFEEMRSDGILDALKCEYRAGGAAGWIGVMGGSYAYCSRSQPGLNCYYNSLGGYDCSIPEGGYYLIESSLDLIYDSAKGWYCVGQESCWLAFTCSSPTISSGGSSFYLHFQVEESGSLYIFNLPIVFTAGTLVVSNAQGENYTGSTQRFLADVKSELANVVPASQDGTCTIKVKRGSGFTSPTITAVLEDRTSSMRAWGEFTPPSMATSHYNYTLNCSLAGYSNISKSGEFYITDHIFESVSCAASPSVVPPGVNLTTSCTIEAESTLAGPLANLTVEADGDMGAPASWSPMAFIDSQSGYFTSSARYEGEVLPQYNGADPANGDYVMEITIDGSSAGFPTITQEVPVKIDDNAGFSSIQAVSAPATIGAGETYTCTVTVDSPDYIDRVKVTVWSGNDSIVDDSAELSASIEKISANLGKITKSISNFGACSDESCLYTSPIQISNGTITCTWEVNFDSASAVTKFRTGGSGTALDTIGKLIIGWVTSNFLLFLILLLVLLVVAKFVKW
jgi:hypothetical protein